MGQLIYQAGVLREKWDDATRTYTAYNAAGVQTSTRPYTAAENVAADAAAAQATRDTNAATLTTAGLTALQANITWRANALPTIIAGVDAIQAKAAATPGTAGAWPSRAQTAPTMANLAAVQTQLGLLYDNVLLPLVLQARDLSLAVESLTNELARSHEIENVLIRIVLGQLDSTEGAAAIAQALKA